MDLFTEEDIKKVLETSLLPESTLYFMVGTSLTNDLLSPLFSDQDNTQEGEDFFEAFTYEVYRFLCDENLNEPKDWVREAMEGDIREIVVYVLSLALSTFNLGLGIAIPLTALFAKKRLQNFCKINPPTPRKTLDQFLSLEE